MRRDPIPVAILGFSDFEREALRSYFRQPALRRTHGYHTVLGIDDAVFIVADSDDPGTLALLEQLERVGDTVFVGGHAPLGAAAWLMRPLTPESVLRELDDLSRQRDHPSATALPLGLPRDLDSDFAPLDALRPLPAEPRPSVPARRSGDPSPADPQRLSPTAARILRPPSRRPRPLVPARALVLDDSDIALHFMHRLLQPYGLTIDLARFSQQALDLLGRHEFGIVFLDVDLGDDGRYDGLQLCHRLRHQFRHPGGRVPMMVMVSAFNDPVDQVRGTLAGAEAFLGKPLDPSALSQLMGRLGFVASAVAAVPGTEPPAAHRRRP
jgi:CheY-like chemotaxis protein